MSLLGGLVQLLQNTVGSVLLSGDTANPSPEVPILSWRAPSLGVYSLTWHVYGFPARGVGLYKNDSLLFSPATILATPVFENIQVVLLAGDTLSVAPTDAVNPGVSVASDLIITQIG